jgi:hypothetical protein
MAPGWTVMLVTLVGLSATVTGCGSLRSEQQQPDGGAIDAGIDAGPAARVCDPDRPMPAEPTTAGSMQGNWKVTWECIDGCPMRRPGLTYSPQLEIVGATQLWSNSRCPECTATYFGEEAIDGCIDVTASADFNSQCRFSYRICEMNGELHGQVTWKEPGVSDTTWKITGRR